MRIRFDIEDAPDLPFESRGNTSKTFDRQWPRNKPR